MDGSATQRAALEWRDTEHDGKSAGHLGFLFIDAARSAAAAVCALLER
jgi:hypothetical protein